MDNIVLMIFLGFVVFFTAALVGIKSANSAIQDKRTETDRYCREERARTETDICKMRNQFESEINKEKRILYLAQTECDRRESVLKKASSNLTAIPYMAAIVADYDTRDLEILARSLDWGSNIERRKKVIALREIRREVKDVITACKQSEYQLAYAIQMFPGLEDFLETDYNDLPELSLSDIESDGHDTVRNYLSKEEYQNLSSVERNQLALDRYQKSHRKTKWQIGRDYELYIGYRYSKKGYSVDYYGSNNGLEDLGRDLIAKKDNITLIIQCKYWSTGKVIHEKHINQLYGTTICYCYENNIPQEQVHAVLVTNTIVSDTAKSFAKYLGVEVVENLATENFPCIKCNINRDEDGNTTKIYHLPFDQQYDACKIDAPGEFFAMTVAEAEAAGFRRAFRWHSESS